MTRKATTMAPYVSRQDVKDTDDILVQPVRIMMQALAVCVLVCATVACAGERDRPLEVDLLSLLPTAERRAAGDINEHVRADVVGIEGDVRPALVMRAPARVTWSLWLPLHAKLTSAMLLVPAPAGVAQGVTMRIGVSDQRKYKEIAQLWVTTSWTPITLDLREYSEWKFSLFDQPLRKRWQLVLNADALPGGLVALERPRLTRS